MVDQTIKTLSYGIFGNSTRDMETGIYSIFDNQNNLYKQYNLVTRKKTFSNGEIQYKQERDSINLNQNFNDLGSLSALRSRFPNPEQKPAPFWESSTQVGLQLSTQNKFSPQKDISFT